MFVLRLGILKGEKLLSSRNSAGGTRSQSHLRTFTWLKVAR